jgi:hypothetical protein
MDKKGLVTTLVAAALITGVGITLNNAKQGQSDLDNPLILPALAGNAIDLSGIKIESSNNQLILQSHKDVDDWVIDNLGNYKADKLKLSGFIKALKAARKVEAKTTKADLYHHLGLQDITVSESQALLITLSIGDKHYKLLIGHSAKNGIGQYVRLVGDAQTWLIDKAISKPEKAQDWVDAKLFDFSVDDIQSITLKGQYQYTLSKVDKSTPSFSLNPIPQGHKLKYASVVDSQARSVANLQFEALVSITDWQPVQDRQTLKLKLFKDDEIIDLMMFKINDKHYVQLWGENDLAKHRWRQWVYQISEYNFNQLVKSSMDYLDLVTPEVTVETTH